MIERSLSPGSVIEAHLDLIRDLTNALIFARATATELQAEIVALRTEVEALRRPQPDASITFSATIEDVRSAIGEQPETTTGEG